jgi:hypothetical protein
MGKQLTVDDARQSLSAHLAAKGDEICARYGPHLGWEGLQLLLQDRSAVRYPCELHFSDQALLPGEFAHPVAKGERPDAGFIMHVHPLFANRLETVPLLVLYQLVLVNYGGFASADDAETFGAHALGLPKEEYYRKLCALADEVTLNPAA